MTTEYGARLLRDLRVVGGGVLFIFVFLVIALRLPLFVTGEFVTADGAPVKEVMVSARNRIFMFGPAWKTRGEVDSRFFAWCLSCKSIRLLFSKVDYLSETLTVHTTRESHGTPEIDRSSSLFGMVQHVTVRMESIADAPSLQHSQGRLEITVRRLPVVLPLDARMRAAPVNFVESQFETMSGSKPGYISIRAERDQAGRILTESRTQPNWRTPGTSAPSFDFAAGFALEFHGEDAGGILFDPPDNLPRLFPSQQVLRRMREAPADGYERVVELPLTATHVNNAWYFYFRSGQQYGKGEVNLPEMGRERDRLSAIVRVWLNVSGTTDLRAKRYR